MLQKPVRSLAVHIESQINGICEGGLITSVKRNPVRKTFSRSLKKRIQKILLEVK